MTDLAREIEELLPCGATCAPMAGCHTCRSRPAILAYVQRKLDEQRREMEWELTMEAMRESDS